jgi:antitoxin MazE
MQVQVAKWGNSLAVRLPASVVETLDLRPGDNIDIHVIGTRSFAVEKAPVARHLLARLRKYRGRLPADFKFDRLGANGRQ